MEEKMSLEDILQCRQIAFQELIIEGKAYCSSGEIGAGYKPLIHLWEFYVNDLRSKWMNESGKQNIELTAAERRDLIMLSNIDKDNVLMSYLKGEQNHPEDIIINVSGNFSMVLLNIYREIDPCRFEEEEHSFESDDSKDEYSYGIRNKFSNKIKDEFTDMKMFYKDFFDNALVNNLNKTILMQSLNLVSDTEIRTHLYEFTKEVEKYNKEKGTKDQEDICNRKISTHNDVLSFTDRTRTMKIKIKDESEEYYNEESFFYNEKEDSRTNLNEDYEDKQKSKFEGGRTTPGGKINEEEFNSKHMTKTIVSLLIGDINLNLTAKRNRETELSLKIGLFELIDHNYTYLIHLVNSSLTNVTVDKRKENKFVEVESEISDIINRQDYDIKKAIEFNKNPPIEYILVRFIVDLMGQEGIRNFIFDFLEENCLIPHFEVERKFFSEYIFKFGINYPNQEDDYFNLNDLFLRVVVPLLEAKGMLAEFKEKVVRKIGEENEKSIKWGIDIKQEGLTLGKEIFTKLIAIDIGESARSFGNKSISSYDNNSARQKTRDNIISDIKTCFKDLYSNFSKYILSSLYPYFLQEKNINKMLTTYLFHYVNLKQNRLRSNSSGMEENEQRSISPFLQLNLHLNPRAYKIFIINEDNKNEVEYSKEEDTKGALEINASEIGIELTNETVSELAVVLPVLTNATGDSLEYASSILDELKKSYLDIFTKFKKMKTKWKIIDYINQKENLKSMDAALKRYLTSIKQKIKNILKTKLFSNFELDKFEVSMIDKLHFITFNSVSKVTLSLSELKFQGGLRDEERPLYLKNRFEVNSLKLAVGSFVIMETKISGLNTVNIVPFIPETVDSVTDVNFDFLHISVSPIIIKLVKNLKDLFYYTDLYKTRFRVVDERAFYKSTIENKTIIEHYFEKLQTQLTEILEEFTKESENSEICQNDKFRFIVKFLQNKIFKMLRLTIGQNGKEDKNVKIDFYCNHREEGNFKRSSIIDDENELICSITIPLMIFSLTDNLFYSNKMLFMKDVETVHEKLKKGEFEMLNINFKKNADFAISEVEREFCSNYLEAVAPSETEHQLDDLKSAMSQFTYVFESNKGLKSIYQNILSLSRKIEPRSIFTISVEKVDILIFSLRKSRFLRLMNQVKIVDEKLKPIEDNKLKLEKVPINEVTENTGLVVHLVNVSINKFTFALRSSLKKAEEGFFMVLNVDKLGITENKSLTEGFETDDGRVNFKVSSIMLDVNIPKCFLEEENPAILVFSKKERNELHNQMKSVESKKVRFKVEGLKYNLMSQREKGTIFMEIDKELTVSILNKNETESERIFAVNKDESILKVEIKDRCRRINTVSSTGLLSNFIQSFKKIRGIFAFDNSCFVDFQVGKIKIVIPSYIFYLVYYLKNHIKVQFPTKKKNKSKTTLNDVHISRFAMERKDSIPTEPNLNETPFELSIKELKLSLKQMKEGKVFEFNQIELDHIYSAVVLEDYTLGVRISVRDIKWIPFNSRYESIIHKKSNCTIPLNLKISLEPKATPELLCSDVNFLLIGKTIKEIVNFLDFNGSCLRQDPTEAEVKGFLNVKAEEKLKLIIRLENFSLIIPESSQSANGFVMHCERGKIEVRSINMSSKLMVLESIDDILYFDKKVAFGLHSQSESTEELLPYNIMDFKFENVEAYFLINGVRHEFGKAKDVGFLFESVKRVNNHFAVVYKHIKEKYLGYVSVVKPRIRFDLSEANLKPTNVQP